MRAGWGQPMRQGGLHKRGRRGRGESADSRVGDSQNDPSFGCLKENVPPTDVPAHMMLRNGVNVKLSLIPLGSGGFCNVQKGFRGKEEFAIKMVNSQHHNRETDAAMQQEAMNMSKLRHRNIIHVEGLLFEENAWACCAIVMELMGGNLLNMPGLETMTFIQKIDVCVQMADGLRFMHRKGYCHLDFKCENVLWKMNADGSSYRIVISDLGMSNVKIATMPETPSLNQDSTSLSTVLKHDRADGTPRYMAPELLAGSTVMAGWYSDVYAFAMVRPKIHN